MRDDREFYEFTWPGKREALLEAGRPTDKVLRPVVEDSEDFGATENLYIEGDNLEALKLLQKSYMHKVKMIYIDPPYNTGHDFIYRDKFTQDEETAQREFEFTDADGERNFSAEHYRENTRSNPRYHSDWCSMIYPRLKVAKTLLREDGVIFISIDDNEVAQLKMICNEIFGEENFIGLIIVKGNPRGRQSSEFFAQVHDFILAYRGGNFLSLSGFELDEETKRKRFNKQDERGEFEELELRKRGADSRREDVPSLWFPIFYNPVTKDISLDETEGCAIKILPTLGDGRDGRWRWSKEKIMTDKKNLYVRKNSKGKYNVYERKSLEDKHTQKPPTIWDYPDVNTELGTKALREIFNGGKFFDYPKPTGLILRLMTLANLDSDSLVLDFFAGSSTTAHALMSLNTSDSGRRKFILVQLPEPCPANSEAAKSGYSTIAELGRERIRRAAKLLLSDSPLTAQQIDTGFRTLRVDSSNFRKVFLLPDDLSQDSLDSLTDNLKPDRSPLDLLFMCATDSGLPLSLPYTSENFMGFTVHHYGSGEIIACLDSGLTEELITHIAKLKPSRALFRDSGFLDAQTRINLEQIFSFYAPDTNMLII